MVARHSITCAFVVCGAGRGQHVQIPTVHRAGWCASTLSVGRSVESLTRMLIHACFVARSLFHLLVPTTIIISKIISALYLVLASASVNVLLISRQSEQHIVPGNSLHCWPTNHSQTGCTQLACKVSSVLSMTTQRRRVCYSIHRLIFVCTLRHRQNYQPLARHPVASWRRAVQFCVRDPQGNPAQDGDSDGLKLPSSPIIFLANIWACRLCCGSDLSCHASHCAHIAFKHPEQRQTGGRSHSHSAIT